MYRRERFLIFSSIGLTIPQHPIFEIAMEYPPKSIHLITSDELHPPNRSKEDSVEKNVENIKFHFERIDPEISVQYGKETRFDLYEIEKNVYLIAFLILKEWYNKKNHNIILDLSTGRSPIKMALSRAGDIALDFLNRQKEENDFTIPAIICVMRPEGRDIVSYEIVKSTIPSSNDQIVLKFVKENNRLSQSAIASKLIDRYPDKKWNQSVVSKALDRLSKNQFATRDKEITEKGQLLLSFLDRIN